MSAATSGRGLGALFKRAWNEIPEVIGSSFMGIIGICLGGAGVLNYLAKDGDFNKYKMEYTVVRDDDPMISRMRKINKAEEQE